jgi:VIT1/CCC1 family predicted Fe2+/Mn2+ transporter
MAKTLKAQAKVALRKKRLKKLLKGLRQSKLKGRVGPMKNPTLISALKTMGAAALGALVPLLPGLLSFLPASSSSILGAILSAVLLHVTAPRDKALKS